MKTVAAPLRLHTVALVAVLAIAGLSAGGAAYADSSDPGVNDPLEGMNRGIFWFNETLDRWFLEPAAHGWDFIVPDFAERAIGRVYDNARFPVVFVNDILQGKSIEAAQDLQRFLLNTTIGAGGLMDVASAIGVAKNDEDFGQTLGFWGVPAGPYLVLPFLGPSSPRDAVGTAADSATQAYRFFVPFWVNLAVSAPNVLNTRASFLEQYAQERRDAIDLYAFRRNLHVKRRENLVRDRAPEGDDDDLYYPGP